MSLLVTFSFLLLLLLLKSYYRSGSIPELLLTLLSNWKRSVKPRPAVSYVRSGPAQAAAVCPLRMHWPSLFVCHFPPSNLLPAASLVRRLTLRGWEECDCLDSPVCNRLTDMLYV